MFQWTLAGGSGMNQYAFAIGWGVAQNDIQKGIRDIFRRKKPSEPFYSYYNMCRYCGYDAQGKVAAAALARGEILTEQDFQDRVNYELYTKHPAMCPGMRDNLEQERRAMRRDYGDNYEEEYEKRKQTIQKR